jgi:hypothetical protein
VVGGLVIEVLGRNDLLDDLLLDHLAELLGGDVRAVLGRHDNSVNTEWHYSTIVVCVLDSDLSLGVRSEPCKGPVVAGIGHCLVERVRQLDGQGQVLGCLVSSVSEHDALITSTKLLKRLLVVKTLCDIRALLLDRDQHVAGLVVETLLRAVVSNVLNRLTNDLLVVDLGLGSDLAENHDHAGLGRGLASNLGERVLLEAGIEDCVRDLVGDLVWVTLADGLGREPGIDC